MGNAVAIESGKAHQRVVKNMSDERGERLSAVNVRKAVVAGEARRRKPHAANSRKNLSHGSIPFDVSFGCFGGTAPPEMICQRIQRARLFAVRYFAVPETFAWPPN
jgi:hypothetical protein